MAAFIEVGRSVQEPVLFAENNIVNGVRLLEAMHQADVGKIVFSSSATVYGNPSRLPISEDDPLGAQNNPYGATKVSTEAFVVTYNQLYGMDAHHHALLQPLRPERTARPGDARRPELHQVGDRQAAGAAVLERRTGARLLLR